MADIDAKLGPILGHRFHRPELLIQALTHPSTQQGRRPKVSAPYERLEFLGDRVLGLVVADMLFARYPAEAEGALARRHAALVRREAVARVANVIGLGKVLVLARGEDEAGGRTNPGILADACEAVIGALYADAGFDVKGAAMASDAFFPFRDGLDVAAEYGITAVIQPGGSMRDDEVIAAADEHGMTMVYTGMRHFRH